jgi:DNA-binding protein HU-beta
MAEGISVNRDMLCDELAQMTGLPKSDCNKVVTALIYDTQLHVKKGDRVPLTGFGTFEQQRRAARTGRNPRTGEPVKVKAARVPRFRAGGPFKEAVNGAKLERPASLKPISRGRTTAAAGGTTVERSSRTSGNRVRTTGAPRASSSRSSSSRAARNSTGRRQPR